MRCWLTLPDPKKPDKLSLRFLTEQNFSSLAEAEQASALLALHHLGPGLPRERVLPEPYRSMWLQLVEGEGGGTETEVKMAADGKKGKKMAAWRVVEEEARAEAEAKRREEADQLEVSGSKPLRFFFLCD